MPEGEKRISGAWSRTSEKAPRKNIWEGKILKKISKKIVALATMAAFVLTLVPAAAFAADSQGQGDPNYSSVQTVLPNPDVAINEDVVLEASVYESDNETTSTLKPVQIWATDEQGRVTQSVKFYSTDANGDKTGSAWPMKDGVVGEESTNNQGEIADGQKFIANFSVEGTYTVHVGQVQTAENGVDKDVVEVNYNDDYKTITVAPRTANTIKFTKEDGVSNLPTDKNVVTLDILNNFPGFEVNGTDSLTIKGNVTDENGKIVRNEAVTMSADKNEIALTKTETKTDKKGDFNVTFKLSDYVNGNITVTCGDVTYTLKVVADKVDAKTISTSLEDGYVLAGNDKLWNQGDYRNFTNAVQFEIKDQKGEAVTGDLSKSEPAFGIGNVTGTQHEDFVSIENKPVKSTLTANDLVVVWDSVNGVYTLRYNSASEQAAKDLVPGEYTVKVALTSNDNAVATFNVAKYGTTEDMVVTTQAKPYGSNDGYYTIDDEIALGDDLKVEAFYVDENGIMIPAKNAEYGADGKAVVGNYNEKYGKNIFQLKANSTVNESLIGTTIDVKVYDDTVKKLVEKELTVVDAYDTYTLAFDPTKGEVNKDNTVAVSVVDADDNLAKKVSGDMYAYVADQSNKDAKVSVSVDKTAKAGKGALTVYSDKETTADIVVAVKSGSAIYASTLEYTFGKEDPYADKSVVMTIGTTDYVVNNEIVKGDAAPYIDSAWRTMVPIRVLAETLGGTVDFKDNVVTIVDGDTTIEMTIGEKTYKVNDKEAEMDTAPVIGSGDRTYVPIRFVGEALGYTVTPLYDGETGTTASVVFQK